jgi:hypothetical protein
MALSDYTIVSGATAANSLPTKNTKGTSLAVTDQTAVIVTIVNSGTASADVTFYGAVKNHGGDYGKLSRASTVTVAANSATQVLVEVPGIDWLFPLLTNVNTGANIAVYAGPVRW